MENPIIKKYKTLLERKHLPTLALSTLPQGYISQKPWKAYCYLQQRISGKLVGRYLKAAEVAQVTEQLAVHKQYEAELLRLSELEQTAC